MKATIDIKTPAGQSLKGFPLKHNPNETDIGIADNHIVFYAYYPEEHTYRKWTLHKGDTITIRIEE